MLGDYLSKEDIEEKISGKGDYVQMDYLSGLIKEKLPRETKHFIYLKLTMIYERRGMLTDSARMCEGLAMISIAFSEKIKHYVKATELYIKAGSFDNADYALKKALSEANATERAEIYFAVKEFYKRQAEAYERELRRNNAVRIYEKLLEMKISEVERKEIKEKLMNLYEKLGRFKELKTLKKLEEKEF